MNDLLDISNPQALLLTPPEAARLLSVSERSLENWRHRGGGPAFVRVSGRCIRYSRAALLDWIADRLRLSTCDPGGRPLSHARALHSTVFADAA
jgi:excisionase family DNA binding protein